MVSVKLCAVFSICLTFFTHIESNASSPAGTDPKKKSGKSNNKKSKKQKKVKVKMVEVDFDIPEVRTAESTAMVDLAGGKFDFGSQFHFEGDRIVSAKVGGCAVVYLFVDQLVSVVLC